MNTFKEILQLLAKYIFTKLTINGKNISTQVIFFNLRSGYLDTSLHTVTGLLNELGSHINNAESAFLTKTKKCGCYIKNGQPAKVRL